MIPLYTSLPLPHTKNPIQISQGANANTDYTGHVHPLPLLSHTKAWEVGFQLGVKKNCCISCWRLDEIWHYAGYSYSHYSGLHDITVLKLILPVSIKEWNSNMETKKKTIHWFPSFNSSFLCYNLMNVRSQNSVWEGEARFSWPSGYFIKVLNLWLSAQLWLQDI